MAEFDPRLPANRYAPALFGCAAVAAAALFGLHLVARPGSAPSHLALRTAPAVVAAPVGPVSVPVAVLPGETLTSAVQRTGVAAGEARAVVAALSQALDVVHIKAGLAFRAAIARPQGRGGPARLVGLSMKTGPVSAVTLSRSFDGALSVRELDEKVRDETIVAHGVMRGSLYESAIAAGATPTLVADAVKLFSKKLDFARDLHPTDEFKLVFDREATENGRTVSTGELLYAEIGVKGRVSRFYRFEHDGKAEYVDEIGKQLKALLLKTPLDGARVTSGFGMRLHPLLGYTRLHPGIDFGAPTGTPVFAAGDGVVEEANWAGGYGHWLKLKHAQGWETGYGHLSRYASGIRPGASVKQGQVVAYVGSTGLSTGPHLHYEVIDHGRKIDPHTARIPTGAVLNAAAVRAFKTQKARVDRLIGTQVDASQAAVQTDLRPRERV